MSSVLQITDAEWRLLFVFISFYSVFRSWILFSYIWLSTSVKMIVHQSSPLPLDFSIPLLMCSLWGLHLSAGVWGGGICIVLLFWLPVLKTLLMRPLSQEPKFNHQAWLSLALGLFSLEIFLEINLKLNWFWLRLNTFLNCVTMAAPLHDSSSSDI